MQSSGQSAAALPEFSGVYVFGDSLVDPGNALKAAERIDDLPFVSLPGGAPTADKGYFQGRFTDGYNFADLVSNKLLLTPTKATFPYGFSDPIFDIPFPFTGRPSGSNLSFAFGGAQAIRGGEISPDLDDQTDAYRNDPAGDPNALYIVTIGANDVRSLVPDDDAPVVGDRVGARLAAVAAEIADEVGALFQFGARHILVTGIPDIGLLPDYLGAPDEAMRRSLATDYAERLDGLLQTALQGLTLPPGAKLYPFSLLDFSERILADPAAYRFTNLTEARTEVQKGALDPTGSGFLFFDPVHPSAQAHAQVAAAILDSLHGASDAPVPLQTGPRHLGIIEAPGGSDAFTASLVAGQSYVFDLLGLSSGSGSLADPELRIVGPTGAVVAEDDDGGLGLDARLAFVAPVTGDYAIQVSGVGAVTGLYALQGPGLRGSNVTVQGGQADDAIAALSGRNLLRGAEGADTISGGSGFDDINGNTGNDSARGGAGDDWVVGGKDDDRLFGDDGHDIVYGNLGNDTCEGGAGDDIVRGGQGNDLVLGGGGADWLAGDRGDDTITGGTGGDVFHTHGDAGLDRVTDFNRAEGDRVNVLAGTQHTEAQVGADVVIEMTGGGRMVLVGVQLSSLTGDWLF